MKSNLTPAQRNALKGKRLSVLQIFHITAEILCTEKPIAEIAEAFNLSARRVYRIREQIYKNLKTHAPKRARKNEDKKQIKFVL